MKKSPNRRLAGIAAALCGIGSSLTAISATHPHLASPSFLYGTLAGIACGLALVFVLRRFGLSTCQSNCGSNRFFRR